MKRKLYWKETDFSWKQNQYTWDDVAIVQKIVTTLTDSSGNLAINKKAIEDLESKFEPKELDQFIKIVCKVNGLDHDEIKFRKSKPMVSIKEVKKTIEEVLSVKITLTKQKITTQ